MHNHSLDETSPGGSTDKICDKSDSQSDTGEAMFQRAKSFIIRRKNPERDYELPESGHLARRPVVVLTDNYINLRRSQPVSVKPTINFDTLRGKCASMESVNVNSSTLQRRAKVMSVDGLDTLKKRNAALEVPKEVPKEKLMVKKTPNFFARLGSRRRKKSEDVNGKGEEKLSKNTFVFIKAEE